MTVNVKMTNGGSDSVNYVNDTGTTLAQVKGYDDGTSNGHLEFYTNTSGTVSEKVRVQNGLHIQQDSSSNNRLVFRGQPSSSYRWNIDNYGSSNQLRFFRENDADASGGSVMMTLDNAGNLQFNSGYGSVATAYGCRAWVNFNGTGTVAIRASGNVTSITDNGTGDYTVNFTTAMPDTNYAITGSSGDAINANQMLILGVNLNYSTSSCRIRTGSGGAYNDNAYVNVLIHR